MKYTLPPEYLFEKKASLEEIRQKHYSDIDPNDFDLVMNEDPTYVPGSDQMGTFGKQLLEWFKKKDDVSYMPGVWKGLLTQLMEMQKSHTLPAGFQINQYPDMDSIRELVAPGSVLAMKVSSFDPTEEKKYIPFLSRMYKAEPGRFDGYDERGAMRLLGYYDWNRLLQMYEDGGHPFDLDSIGSFFDLKWAVFEYTAKSDGVAGHYGILHQGDNLLVRIYTKFANEVFGFGTKWCTTWESTSYYSHYDQEGGPLIQYMPYMGNLKDTADSAMEDKFQFYCAKDGTHMEIENGNKAQTSLSRFLTELDDNSDIAFRNQVLSEVGVSRIDDLTTEETRYGNDDYEEEYETEYFFRVRVGYNNQPSMEYGYTQGGDETVDEDYEVDPTKVDLSRDRLDPAAMAAEPLSVWQQLDVSPTHLVHAVGFEEDADALTENFIDEAVGHSQNGVSRDLYPFRNGQTFPFVWKNPCGHTIEDIELAKGHEEDFFSYIGDCYSIGDDFYVVVGEHVPYTLAPFGAVDLSFELSLPEGWKGLLPDLPQQVKDADEEHRFKAMEKAGLVRMSTLSRFMSRAASTEEWSMDFPINLSMAGSSSVNLAVLSLSSLKPAGGLTRVDHPSQATFPPEEFEDWQPVTDAIESAKAPTYRHELHIESLVKKPLAIHSDLGLPLDLVDEYARRLVYWISRDFGTVSVDEGGPSIMLEELLSNTNGFRKTKNKNVLLVVDPDSDEAVPDEDPEDEVDGVNHAIRSKFQDALSSSYNRLRVDRMATSVEVNSILEDAVEYFLRSLSKETKSYHARNAAVKLATSLLKGASNQMKDRNFEVLIDRLDRDLSGKGPWS